MGRLRSGGYAFTVPALRSGGKGARWVRRSGCRGMGRVTSRCWERRIYTVRGASVMDARSRPDGSASVSMRLQLQRFDQAGKARVGFEEVVAGAWAGLRRGTGNGEAASSRGASVMDAGSRPDGSASFGWICVYSSSASIRRERRASGSKKWLPGHGQGCVEVPGTEKPHRLAGLR